MVEKYRSTIKNILAVLKADKNFPGSKRTLETILKTIGYSWQSFKDNRNVLVEEHHIRYNTFNYLRKIMKLWRSRWPIILIDETYIHSTHSKYKGWHRKDSDTALIRSVSKGKRLIIVTASREMGFIPNYLTIWKSKQEISTVK